GSNDKLVHLSGASSNMAGDITVDNIADAANSSDYDFYAGIMPVAFTNTTNPGGTMDNTHTATFQTIVSANDDYNNVWISDAAGAYSGVLIYDNSFDALVAVGDEILMVGERTVYNNLTELENPQLISTVSTGNSPYGPAVINGSDIDSIIPADTDPGEKWEGQLVKIENFTVESYTDYDYMCSWSDGTTTYYFHVGDNVNYHFGDITMQVGETYASITGVVDWYWSGPFYRINPRNQGDIETFAATARIVGSFQGWNTTDPDYVLSENANGVWELTKTLSAGDNEYKVLEGDDWSQPNYPSVNQHIILTGDEDITWKVNITDELVTHTIPVVAGNFISELGGNDWDPTDLIGEMEDPDGDDIFTLVLLVPFGDWECKVTLNHNWDQSTGGNVPFSSNGVDSTTFTYDMSTNYTEVSGPPPVFATITFVVDDSQGQTFGGFFLKGSWTPDGFYDPGWGGGVEHAPFYDDGTHGDVTPGDHIFATQYDLAVDYGANTWEWGVNDQDHNWVAGNWQFTIPDSLPQTLTHIFPGIPDLVITEIMYNPPEAGTDSLEFVEVYNNTTEAVELENYYFSQGFVFSFPQYQLNAGDFVLIAVNAEAMMNTFGVTALEWTSGGLSNGGEDIILMDNLNRMVDIVDYDDSPPWPTEPDGNGPSLVFCDPSQDNSIPDFWSSSMDYTGVNAAGDSIYASPGTGCIYSPPDVVITEIMYNPPETGTDSIEFIEIYNNEPVPTNLNGFKLTKSVSFTFPNITLAVGEYLVIAYDQEAFENTFGFSPLEWASGSLSNTGGEVELNDAYGFTTDYVPYDDEAPWPPEANGFGPSLTFCDPSYDNSIPDFWSASLELAAINAAGDSIFATPGAECGAMVPIADFEADQTQIEAGQSVNFTDLSLGDPLTWSWSFPGGTPSSSNDQDPQGIVYNTAGIYDVTLTVVNNYGQDTETKTGYIVVLEPGSPPVADFMASETAIFTGQSIDFTDLSLGEVDSWAWSFAGGTPSTSTQKNPVGILYNSAGEYDVSLTVTNAYGEDTEVKAGYISVTEPIQYDLVISEIMYNPPEAGTDSLEFIELYNNDVETIYLEGFYFTDGILFTFPDVTMTPGEYLLIAQNATAFFNTFGVNAYQWDDGSSLNNGGEPIELSNQFGSVLDYVPYDDEAPWPTEPDGQGPSLTLCNPSDDNSLAESWSASTEFIAINSAGDSIFATPGGGCTEIPPVANFLASETIITVGSSIDFTDLSTGIPTSWSWTFEGASPASSTAENPTGIVYNAAGSYDVTLVVTNEYGEDTEYKADYILVGYAPEAAFFASETAISVGESVQFTDESTGDPVTWTWIFEGGTPITSNEQNPLVVYNNAGDFDVILIVANTFGESTETKTEYIHVTVGLEEIGVSIADIAIYPNPGDGQFYINSSGVDLAYEIYSIVGQFITSDVITQKVQEINLTDLDKGIYFIKLTDENSNEYTIKKLIIN
ncbi:MAG: lamin tail domain-containing protein, partial [Bacteroidales bacterium]|nr:lamin tail domain-containing protein [Bacteroidales bacterium]